MAEFCILLLRLLLTGQQSGWRGSARRAEEQQHGYDLSQRRGICRRLDWVGHPCAEQINWKFSMSQQAKIKNGKIGEVLVELELLKRDWHVERLDGATKAVNGDLIAIRGFARIVIQVKSALSWNRPSFGHAGPYLLHGRPFFNKDSPTVMADVLVTVSGSVEHPVFHIFKIDEAEMLARTHAKKWYEQKKRTGEQRSPHFPLSFHPDDEAIDGSRDAWNVLDLIT